MHNLAIALHQKGEVVTGSDDTIFDPSKSRLEKYGLLPPEFGWFPDKLKTVDVVILGMHAKSDNPELAMAKKLGLKIYSYPEFLYEQSKDKTRVVIGGSHGKTSITAMILHVLNYHDIEVDYMVGAQLDGFETMVHLTSENEFIVLEGDEYLSSPIDMRPKFHLYKPNIALISGIAWDHINVFPTFENYMEQFSIFVDSIINGGTLVYCTEDGHVKEVSERSKNAIKKYPYALPEYENIDGTTFVNTPEGMLPLDIFGEHNLQNMEGAKAICQHMGVDESLFFEAIGSFKGANKRLEKIIDKNSVVIFKDFAHAPSKVRATTKAVRDQYSNRRFVACLELHTYSSLNTTFLKEYKDALNQADEAVVFYSPHAVEIKRLDFISKDQIRDAFDRDDLIVFTEPKDFENYILSLKFENLALLLMSSGNYGGLDFNVFSEKC